MTNPITTAQVRSVIAHARLARTGRPTDLALIALADAVDEMLRAEHAAIGARYLVMSHLQRCSAAIRTLRSMTEPVLDHRREQTVRDVLASRDDRAGRLQRLWRRIWRRRPG